MNDIIYKSIGEFNSKNSADLFSYSYLDLIYTVYVCSHDNEDNLTGVHLACPKSFPIAGTSIVCGEPSLVNVDYLSKELFLDLSNILSVKENVIMINDVDVYIAGKGEKFQIENNHLEIIYYISTKIITSNDSIAFKNLEDNCKFLNDVHRYQNDFIIENQKDINETVKNYFQILNGAIKKPLRKHQSKLKVDNEIIQNLETRIIDLNKRLKETNKQIKEIRKEIDNCKKDLRILTGTSLFHKNY